MDGTTFTCRECTKPVFKLHGNILVIKARHHGEWHTTAIPIDILVNEASSGVDVYDMIRSQR